MQIEIIISFWLGHVYISTSWASFFLNMEGFLKQVFPFESSFTLWGRYQGFCIQEAHSSKKGLAVSTGQKLLNV